LGAKSISLYKKRTVLAGIRTRDMTLGFTQLPASHGGIGTILKVI